MPPSSSALPDWVRNPKQAVPDEAVNEGTIDPALPVPVDTDENDNLDSVFDDENDNLDSVFDDENDNLDSVFDDENDGAVFTAAPKPELPVEQEPATPFTMPAKKPQARTGVARRRQAALAATPDEDDSPKQPVQAVKLRRYTEATRLAPYVEALLNLGAQGGSPKLQALLKRVVLTRDADKDSQQREEYEDTLNDLVTRNRLDLGDPKDRETIFDMAYDDLLGIGPLGPLWRDDSVSEILVFGPGRVTVERNGHLEITDAAYRNLRHLEESARALAQLSEDDRTVSSTSPVPTLHLDGARAQFVWHPIAVNGVEIAIRKFGKLHAMEDLLEFGSLTENMAELLEDLVKSRSTILVSGGTGSGKTTFINALSGYISNDEHVITIEDARELNLQNTHVTPLVTKEAASADDTVRFDQAILLTTSLRMRPDRIIVGEVREGNGCAVMLEAANTGHDGTMTTVHSNSPEDALARMVNLLRRTNPMPIEVARSEVGGAIDAVVQVVRKNGRRFVSNISLVEQDPDDTTGSLTTTPLFVGEYGPSDSSPVFRRVGSIEPTCAVVNRFLEAGVDPERWE